LFHNYSSAEWFIIGLGERVGTFRTHRKPPIPFGSRQPERWVFHENILDDGIAVSLSHWHLCLEFPNLGVQFENKPTRVRQKQFIGGTKLAILKSRQIDIRIGLYDIRLSTAKDYNTRKQDIVQIVEKKIAQLHVAPPSLDELFDYRKKLLPRF
jgi:hypothetical protein